MSWGKLFLLLFENHPLLLDLIGTKENLLCRIDSLIYWVLLCLVHLI